MKKIFTLLLSLGSLTTVFAQHNNVSNEISYRTNSYQNKQYNGNSSHNASNAPYGKNDSYGTYGNDNRNPGRNEQNSAYNQRNNRDRQAAEMDRMNRDYDRRINDYRNDRSMDDRERNRRIADVERERNDKLKSFGGGVIVGGILGVLLGSHL